MSTNLYPFIYLRKSSVSTPMVLRLEAMAYGVFPFLWIGGLWDAEVVHWDYHKLGVPLLF